MNKNIQTEERPLGVALLARLSHLSPAALPKSQGLHFPVKSSLPNKLQFSERILWTPTKDLLAAKSISGFSYLISLETHSAHCKCTQCHSGYRAAQGI